MATPSHAAHSARQDRISPSASSPQNQHPKHVALTERQLSELHEIAERAAALYQEAKTAACSTPGNSANLPHVVSQTDSGEAWTSPIERTSTESRPMKRTRSTSPRRVVCSRFRFAFAAGQAVTALTWHLQQAWLTPSDRWRFHAISKLFNALRLIAEVLVQPPRHPGTLRGAIDAAQQQWKSLIRLEDHYGEVEAHYRRVNEAAATTADFIKLHDDACLAMLQPVSDLLTRLKQAMCENLDEIGQRVFLLGEFVETGVRPDCVYRYLHAPGPDDPFSGASQPPPKRRPRRKPSGAQLVIWRTVAPGELGIAREWRSQCRLRCQRVPLSLEESIPPVPSGNASAIEVQSYVGQVARSVKRALLFLQAEQASTPESRNTTAHTSATATPTSAGQPASVAGTSGTRTLIVCTSSRTVILGSQEFELHQPGAFELMKALAIAQGKPKTGDELSKEIKKSRPDRLIRDYLPPELKQIIARRPRVGYWLTIPRRQIKLRG